MAFIDLDLGASPHPEHTKPSRGVQEGQHFTEFDRWLPWQAWRDVETATPDAPPHTLALSHAMIVDVRGCLGVHVIGTTEILTAAGALTTVTDWSARLWTLCGPAAATQWAVYDDLGSQGASPAHKFYAPLPGVWYVALQVYAMVGALGVLKVSVRPV